MAHGCGSLVRLSAVTARAGVAYIGGPQARGEVDIAKDYCQQLLGTFCNAQSPETGRWADSLRNPSFAAIGLVRTRVAYPSTDAYAVRVDLSARVGKKEPLFCSRITESGDNCPRMKLTEGALNWRR